MTTYPVPTESFTSYANMGDKLVRTVTVVTNVVGIPQTVLSEVETYVTESDADYADAVAYAAELDLARYESYMEGR